MEDKNMLLHIPKILNFPTLLTDNIMNKLITLMAYLNTLENWTHTKTKSSTQEGIIKFKK